MVNSPGPVAKTKTAVDNDKDSEAKSPDRPRRTLNKTLALEAYGLFRELSATLREEETALAQLAGMIDRTPTARVDNEFLNTLGLRLKERKMTLARTHLRTDKMAQTLHKRLEAEGVLKVKVRKVKAGRPPPKTIRTVKTSAASLAEIAGHPVCVGCSKELVRGARFARCNIDNIVFHADCLSESYYRCPTCDDDLSDFMSVY